MMMPRTSTPTFAIVAAVNNDRVLQQNLAASPCLRDGDVQLHCERQAASAGIAYNRALDQHPGEIIIFAHQDVYLPDGWLTRVHAALDTLSRDEPQWAVAGVVGVDERGALLGRCWSNGLNREIVGHTATALPAPAVSLDEIVLIVRADSGVRFDDTLPGFHLYGTDIAQQAMRMNRTVHVIDAPVVHNSVPIVSLDESFRACYRTMQRKWRPFLPIPTCVVPLTRSAVPLWRQRWRLLRKAMLGGAAHQSRHDAPRQIALQCGYEQPATTRIAA